MPKETVEGAHGSFAIIEGNEVGLDDIPMDNAEPLKFYERRMITRWARESGYVELGVAKVEITTEDEEVDAHYVLLTRDAINRQIRIMRKARDQAFGADA